MKVTVTRYVVRKGKRRFIANERTKNFYTNRLKNARLYTFFDAAKWNALPEENEYIAPVSVTIEIKD